MADKERSTYQNYVANVHRRVTGKKDPGQTPPRFKDNRELSEREILFIEAYITSFNVVQSAKEAGYATGISGYHLLARPIVARAIYERLKFEKMAAPEIINRVGALARADMKHFLRIEEVPTGEEEEAVDEETGEITRIKVTSKRVVVDLIEAIQRDETYPLKSVEFYRTGEVKKITIEDRLEAIKLIGAAYGLFGTRNAGDDSGRAWFERARDLGIEPRAALEEMIKIAEEWKVQLPKEIVEGQFQEKMSEEGAIEIEFANPDAIAQESDENV